MSGAEHHELTLSVPDELDRFLWQAVVVGLNGPEVSNRMETLVRGLPLLPRPLRLPRRAL